MGCAPKLNWYRWRVPKLLLVLAPSAVVGGHVRNMFWRRPNAQCQVVLLRGEESMQQSRYSQGRLVFLSWGWAAGGGGEMGCDNAQGLSCLFDRCGARWRKVGGERPFCAQALTAQAGKSEGSELGGGRSWDGFCPQARCLGTCRCQKPWSASGIVRCTTFKNLGEGPEAWWLLFCTPTGFAKWD